MSWNHSKLWSALALPALAVTSLLSAADKQMNNCQQTGTCCPPQQPAPCYSVAPPCCDFCLGPENVAVNPAVRPRSCNGVFFTVDVLYWKATEDGLAYGIDTGVLQPSIGDSIPIIDGKVQNPNFKWDWGFKVGLGYNSSCDGWDVNLLWTHFQDRGHDRRDADSEDNRTLIPLYSVTTGLGFASDGRAHWKLQMDLVDFELGREFWVSKYVTLRPFVGLRYARLDQSYDIVFRGGSFTNTGPGGNDDIDMSNDFKGIGARAGIDTVWNLCRGFAIFGDAAVSILWGRFSLDQSESIRDASPNFSKQTLFSMDDGFHATRGAMDVALGIQWGTMFCDCRYGFTIGLAWEFHQFFNQNQFWRITTPGAADMSDVEFSTPSTYTQSRGDLSTQGVTLNLKFEF